MSVMKVIIVFTWEDTSTCMDIRLRVVSNRCVSSSNSMAGWLRGTVVNVRSGDTLTIAGAVKSGIPPQKRITLSSLKAPTLGRGDGSSVDEPFAWASREALRKLTIGQPVIFKIDYVVDSISREFGTVFLENGNKDISVLQVSQGWAKVRQQCR